MSSMEKERVSGKKREKLGALSGRKVLEPKKEIKKRRLILSDSESDDGNFKISPRDKGLKVAVADQVENRVNGVEMEVRSELGSEVVKQIERAEGDHKLAEVCRDVNGSSTEERSSIDELAGEEKLKVESLRCLSSKVVEVREEAQSQKVENPSVTEKENGVGQLNSKDEIKVETEMASIPADVKTQEVADIVKNSTVGELKVETEMAPIPADVEMQEVADIVKNSTVAELKGEVEMGSRSVVDEMQEGADTVKKSTEHEVKGEAEMGSRSVVAEMQEGADAVKKSTEGELKGEAETGSRSVVSEMQDGAVIMRKPMEDEVRKEAKVVSRSLVAKKRDGGDRMKKPIKVEIKGEVEMVSSSLIDKKQEVDRIKKSIEGKTKMEAEMVSRSVVNAKDGANRSKKLVDVSRNHQNGSGSAIKKNNSLQRLGSEEDVKPKAKTVFNSHVSKERGGVDSHKVSADAKRVDASSYQKKGSDRLSSGEKLESNNGGNSEVNKREESDSVKKKVMDSGSDKKRIGDALDGDIISKKLKLELLLKARRQESSIMGTDKKNWKRNVLKTVDKRRDTETDHHLESKPVASSASWKDNSSEKRIHVNLKRRNALEVESGKTTGQPPARKIRQLKDDALLDGVRSEEAVISQQKGVRVQSKTGVLRVLHSDKVNGLKKVHIQGEDKELRKSVADQPSPSKKSNVEKPISTVKSGRKQLNRGKVCLTETADLCKVKAQTEARPETSTKVKLKKLDSSNVKSASTAKGERKLKSKASHLTKLNTVDKSSEKRSTVKQRIREQIKDILLNAGWRIELKPRKGRTYEDSVYVPPTGGSGYWSITKAYGVYLKTNNISENSSKESASGDQSHEGTSSRFATIPPDLLQMLTRNVVNKRRSTKEMKEAKKKRGGKGKGKATLKVKDSKKSSGAIRKNDNERGRLQKWNTNAEVAGSSAHEPHLSIRDKKKKGCALLVRRAKQDAETEDDYDDDGYVPYVWKRTIMSWMIDLGIVHVDGKVMYMNKSQKRALLEGSITRDGIRCGCCSKIISISKFEIHADSKLDQPYQNIFVEAAEQTLLQCQLNAWEKQKESERQDFYNIDIEGDDPNDDTCGLCGDGGDLICCDSCPSTFHLNCLDLQMPPPGDWHCTNCSCRFCGSVSNAVLHGTASAATLLTCSQCEKKYHSECIPEADAVCSSNPGTSFCGLSCKKVFKRLQKLIGTKHDIEAGLSWRVVRCFHDDSRMCSLPQKAECNSKIAVAFAVMDECFRPIIDQRSGINLIHNVVYNCGSNINRLSYTGFYTFILERGDEIISVASVRIHGTRLAEMPFIGTRDMYRRQGMCRQLLNGIESALHSLNVEKLIIPAISELTETWTSIFGFKPLELSQKQEVKSINMLVFPGTGLLQKQILKDSSAESLTSEKAEVGETIAEHKDMAEPAVESSVLSHSSSKTCSPAEVAVQSENELESAEPMIESNNSSDADASPGSEFRTRYCKSPETLSNVTLSIQPTQVLGNEFPADEKFHVNSSHELKIKIPSEDSLHGNYEVECVPISVALESHAAVDTMRHAMVIEDQHLLEAENGSSVCSDLHNTGEVVAHPNTEAGDAEVIDNKLSADDEFHVTSHELKIKIPSEDSLHGNCEVESVPYSVALENHAAVDTSGHAKAIEDHQLLEAEDGSSVCSNLHGTDEVVVHPNTEADAKPFLPTSETTVFPECY